MEKLLYGAAYYDEYMPYERLEEDIKMMKNEELMWYVSPSQPGVLMSRRMAFLILVPSTEYWMLWRKRY